MAIVLASLMREEGTTGVQTHMRAFAQQLRRGGHAVEVVTPFSAPKPIVYALVALRRVLERVHRPSAVWLYRQGHAWCLKHALRRVLARERDAVVYAQCPVSADAALRTRVSRSQTVTLAVHFNVSQADEWAGKGAIAPNGALFHAIREFEADVLPRVDALVFVSAFAERELLARIPALAEVRRDVVPNFIADPGEPKPWGQAQADAVCIGTLEPRKNQHYLLEIVAAARQAGHRLTVTVAGDGPDRHKLEVQARRLGVADLVHFAGFVPNAARLLPEHRACLHVATMESFGIALVEALAAGRPVFAAAVGGTPEVFDDEVEGRVIPLDDAAEAARIVCSVLDDPAQLLAMAQAARRRFLERYESTAVVERLRRFLMAAGSANTPEATRRVA